MAKPVSDWPPPARGTSLFFPIAPPDEHSVSVATEGFARHAILFADHSIRDQVCHTLGPCCFANSRLTRKDLFCFFLSCWFLVSSLAARYPLAAAGHERYSRIRFPPLSAPVSAPRSSLHPKFVSEKTRTPVALDYINRQGFVLPGSRWSGRFSACIGRP